MPPLCRLQRLYRTRRSSLRPAPCQPSAVHLSPSATLSHTPLLIEARPTPAFCYSFIAFSDSEAPSTLSSICHHYVAFSDSITHAAPHRDPPHASLLPFIYCLQQLRTPLPMLSS